MPDAGFPTSQANRMKHQPETPRYSEPLTLPPKCLRSRRDRLRISQGKRSAALGNRHHASIAPGRGAVKRVFFPKRLHAIVLPQASTLRPRSRLTPCATPRTSSDRTRTERAHQPPAPQQREALSERRCAEIRGAAPWAPRTAAHRRTHPYAHSCRCSSPNR